MCVYIYIYRDQKCLGLSQLDTYNPRYGFHLSGIICRFCGQEKTKGAAHRAKPQNMGKGGKTPREYR